MEISYNTKQGIYLNKTARFLAPIISNTPEMARLINKGFYKLALGIDDYLYNKKKGRFIFILVYNKVLPRLFENSLEQLRLQPLYVDDYPVNNNEHMLVIEVDKKYAETYDNFLRGKYSKMYNKEFIYNTFSEPQREKAKNVLLKNETAKWEYYSHLKNLWGIHNPMELNLQEYEEPLKYKEEIFNYTENKPIYIQINE